MIEIICALVLVLFVIWIGWRWQHTSIFVNAGIPGPKPNLLFGNLIELFTKGPIKCHGEWIEKYGNVVGYFYGMKPVVLIADPQLLKDIYIKDFSKFTNRELFNPLAHPIQTDEINQSVLSLRDQKWKEVRSILSPSFTAAKMKQMVPSMNVAIDDLIAILKKHAENGELIDIHNKYQRLTMDVISRTAFGVIVDVQKNKDSELLHGTKLIFSFPYKSVFLFLGLSFPALRYLTLELEVFLLRFLNRGLSPLSTLRKGLKQVLSQRRVDSKIRKPDLLQLMMDNKITLNTKDVDVRKLEAGNVDIEKITDEKSEDQKSKVTRNMTTNEIIASSAIVLLAGYETTSTALSFTTYLLSKNPHIQEKAFQEIQGLIQSGEKLEYGTVNKLQYLDQILNESMRIYPPVCLFTNRYASQEMKYGNVTIPKGVIVQAPTYNLHHDPNYWADPEIFDPDRFETKPNTNGIIYLPFGIGPRNCLGMRFAQMEAKLALAHVIYNYKIYSSKEQEANLPVSFMVRTLTPSEGVKVKLELRSKETAL